MSDDFKDEIRSRMGDPDHPYNRFFDADETTRELVDEAIRGWVGWPTDPDAAPIWATAFGETQNMNDRMMQALDPMVERESMLDLGASPNQVEAIREYREFVRGYTRSIRGDTVQVYRYVEEPPEDAANLEGFIVESWTDDVTLPREFARNIRGAEEGSVVTIPELPVERLYGTPQTHPAIKQKEQSEHIVAHPPNTVYDGFEITPLSEWEF